ncbi:hypothetical protein V6N11_065869 [Hibiscus sabdariffa]|uniref:Cleavage inducing molecular chaperone Jiv domain-containing protein n=1 Tax=Hibiscus sabdariffa TaxID=183260 RepID=A0ABR2PIK4_9ROSI
MARKGNQQKNGKQKVLEAGHRVSNVKERGKANEKLVFHGEELPNGNPSDGTLTETVSKGHQTGTENPEIPATTEKHADAAKGLGQSISSGSNSGDCIENAASDDPSTRREWNEISPDGNLHLKHKNGIWGCLLNGSHLKDAMENVKFSDYMAVRNMRAVVRASAASTLKVISQWLERQRPIFISLTTKMYNVRDHVKVKVERLYPIVLTWLRHFGNIMLLLSIIWLDCTLRGIDSFLRMGTTSFFSVIWCSIFSVIAMVGMLKFLMLLVVAALTAVFIGFTLAMLVVALFGFIFLWFYGSFWTTLLVIFLGGLAYSFSHERLALSITTIYSVYCAWMYAGWLGLLLAINLSFISSDILIYYLKNNINQQARPNVNPEQTNGTHASFSENSPGFSADRGPGVASTSGVDTEITSEEEVARLLNCTDYYTVLGLSRYQNVDVNALKREYRKKAMMLLKNFKMHEVLLDSMKRKAYDDELRREELLNYFRRFQNASQKNGGHGIFPSGFGWSEADGEEAFGEPRRISCKKCGNFHFWIQTKKSKSQARWCQECQGFHQAKDGDGWVEQSSQPFLFGLLQKVGAPTAYVCADSKIYNATEWYACQGMRCPPNTHKPSFHVNTSLTSKHSTSKGSSSGQRGGKIPTPNPEETMTEAEFLEWLQNAAQAGMFDDFLGSSSAESPVTKPGSGSKTNGSNMGGGTGTGTGNKRKKKGKKQWALGIGPLKLLRSKVDIMAGHSDSSSSEKKSSEAMTNVPIFSAENMQNNMKVIYYSRTFMSIIGGVIAGILGFTGFMGFVFYFLVMAITSIGLIAKAKFSVHSYFDSWNRIILDGFMGGLMSFVLFWTFAYDIVHIF